MTSLEMVKEFHEKFNHPVTSVPAIHSDELNDLRISLLDEELSELSDALEDRDPVEVLDALCDLQVVLDGAFLSLGFWRVKDEAMAEVHRSNMSKLDVNGKPLYRYDGKILKGPNFSSPNLEAIVNKLT